MKKKIAGILIITLCMAMFSGCQKKEEVQKPGENNPKPEVQVDKEESNENKEEEKPVEVQKVTIFMPDENAEGFVTEEAAVEKGALTEGWLVDQLIEKQVLSEGTKVNLCKKTEVNGVPSLELDLNEAFQKRIQSMGTSGEYVILGSVVNTFLSAYECEQVKITVNGEVLMSGHAIYEDYLKKYEGVGGE